MVWKYFEEYAEEVRNLMRLHTQVLDVRPHRDEDTGGVERWEVTFLDLRSRQRTTLYDAVVVAKWALYRSSCTRYQGCTGLESSICWFNNPLKSLPEARSIQE